MKEINIKHCPYYFFNYMVNTKNSDPSLLGIYKWLCKSASINIYYTEYMIMKSLNHVSINSKNSLYNSF